MYNVYPKLVIVLTSTDNFYIVHISKLSEVFNISHTLFLQNLMNSTFKAALYCLYKHFELLMLTEIAT